MVRRRIEIEPIQNKDKLHTTFTKRRKGLEKKIKELCSKCDAEGAVIAFSKAGNAFSFGSPRVDLLVSRYLARTSSSLSSNGGGGETTVEEAQVEMAEAEKRIGEAMESGRWGAAVRDLELRELDELAMEIAKIKSAVATSAMLLASRGENILFSSGDSISN